MFALVYVSKETQPFRDKDLIELASAAAKKNSELNITGYLFHKGKHFFQYLEGDKISLGDLISSIKRDERHRISRLIEIGEISERNFADWNMRYVTPGELLEIDLEDIAQDVILRMTEPTFSEHIVKDRILRIVKRIAELQTGNTETGSTHPT